MFIRLFYTTTCNECNNLRTVIRNENIEQMFIQICLDNCSSKQLGEIMTTVKVLPTIVISVENQPSAIFEGPFKCSQWLTNFTANRRKNIAQSIEQRRRLIQKEQNLARQQDGGTDGYVEAEMEGVSDNYSYNVIEICQPKNFVMCGDEESSSIMTPRHNESKVDTDTMKRQLVELEASRNTDTQQFMKVMEQNQIAAVINYNYNNNM